MCWGGRGRGVWVWLLERFRGVMGGRGTGGGIGGV